MDEKIEHLLDLLEEANERLSEVDPYSKLGERLIREIEKLQELLTEIVESNE